VRPDHGQGRQAVDASVSKHAWRQEAYGVYFFSKSNANFLSSGAVCCCAWLSSISTPVASTTQNLKQRPFTGSRNDWRTVNAIKNRRQICWTKTIPAHSRMSLVIFEFHTWISNQWENWTTFWRDVGCVVNRIRLAIPQSGRHGATLASPAASLLR
jgi:hypothetical protein